MKMHVWTDLLSFLAVAHSDSIAESRQMLLHGSLGGSGDGSCPERDKARRVVMEEPPNIYHGKNEEFVLTDSAELRECEQELEHQNRRIAQLTKIIAAFRHGQLGIASDLIQELDKASVASTNPPSPIAELAEPSTATTTSTSQKES